ncbi:MAG TPA: SDR family oxidoreductase [Actinomycetota bacterium]|nr:SDR family oxidoreductase [Actinomycetota bacterium]
MGSLDGRRALVTGGASGIGLATVRRLVAEGAAVALCDRDAEAGRRVAEEIGGAFVCADMSDAPQVADSFARTADVLGGLDLVHLNAGVTTGQGDLTALTEEQYRRIMGVNVDGVVYGVREAARMMRGTGGGDIVCTASLAGIVTLDSDPIYTLTKHAVVGLVRAGSVGLSQMGVRLNAVCPGIVETPLVGEDALAFLREAGFPLIEPDQVAEAVVQAVTSGVSGQCWVVQPGRSNERYRFPGVPGPRTEGAEGMAPPTTRI